MSYPLRQPLVLLVDDTPANLRVLFDLLNNRGFEVAVAEDGESALEQLEYIHPDLILLDVLMPVMDGYTACRRLKERPETRDIPVIFMSALTDTAEQFVVRNGGQFLPLPGRELPAGPRRGVLQRGEPLFQWRRR